MLESGPAAGVIGTQALCHTLGIKNAIAFDMGGTTAKAGVIYKGEALTTGAALIGGYDKALPVQIAMMDIFEVGTGGGSIARAEDGALRVGPQSAGAQPGPACYGQGGEEPTVTDANLVLGRLDADHFLGGEMTLDVKAAERALAKVGKPLGMSATEAADGILRIASTAMSYAVKGVTTERGLDAGDFALVAYGGAGPLHAVAVAREIGIRNVIVPGAPGVFSAFGMLFSDLRYDYVRTHLMQLGRSAVRRDRDGVPGAGAAGPRRHRLNARSSRDKITVKRALDMRYVGQEHPVTVELPMRVFQKQDRKAIKQHFDDDHMQRYGTSAPNERAEIVSLRVTVDRPDEEAAAGEDQARPGSAAEVGFHRQAAGVVRRPIPRYADLAPRRTAGRQQDQRPGADRGARLDHGADAGRPDDGGCLWQSGDRRRGSEAMRFARPSRHTRFPSPLAGEGTRAEAIAERRRVRGRTSECPLRSPPSPARGEGSEPAATVSIPHLRRRITMAKKTKSQIEKIPQGRSGDRRDRAQRRARRDRGDEDQPHAHGLQHDHLRGAGLHHRPVHAGGRDRVDRHRAADLHPRHGGDREGEDPPLRRHQEHEAGRHLRHQRFLHHRQPSQSLHLHAADLPQGQARRLLLLHGALARRRRRARRHDHGHLFRGHPDPDREVPGPRQDQPGPARHHPHERAAAAARHGRPARAGHRGEDRRAALPRTARPLRPRRR